MDALSCTRNRAEREVVDKQCYRWLVDTRSAPLGWSAHKIGCDLGGARVGVVHGRENKMDFCGKMLERGHCNIFVKEREGT